MLNLSQMSYVQLASLACAVSLEAANRRQFYELAAAEEEVGLCKKTTGHGAQN